MRTNLFAVVLMVVVALMLGGDAQKALAQSIAVISPVGGDTLEIGKTYAITWTTSGFDSNAKVRIDLFDNLTIFGKLFENSWAPITDWLPGEGVPNTGSYLWTVPEKITIPVTGGPDELSPVIGHHRIFLDVVGDIRGTLWEAQATGDSFTIVPEPATMVLFGLGGLLALRRRR